MMSAETTEAGEQAARARAAAQVLATCSRSQRHAVIARLQEELVQREAALVAANEKDLEAAAAAKYTYIERLKLAKKLPSLKEGLKQLCELEDPLGKVTLARSLADGLRLFRVTVPIGVLLVIFEARPEAAVQIFSLAVLTGNAVILKGGKEATETLKEITAAIRAAIEAAGLPPDCCQLVVTRSDVQALLKQERNIDLVIPRGSNALVQSVMNGTRIPVIGHSDGICHCYVDASAHVDMAVKIVRDAKTSYPSACNTLETLLVHASAAPALLQALPEAMPGVIFHADPRALPLLGPGASVVAVGPDDFNTEWGELQMSVAVVDSLDEAIAHITKHGSKHTEVVVSEDRAVQERFVTAVDAGGVYVNASSRFADGFRYGFGAEVGVSTARLHARGPVGLEGLLSYKYRVYGHGHVTAGEDGVVFDHKDIPGVATVDDIGTDEALLRQPVAEARRILIKVGSGVVTQLSTSAGDAPDGGIATGRVAHVAEQVAQLVKSGREVCLVSSGAVAAGRRILHHAHSDGSTGRGVLERSRSAQRRELPIPGDPIPQVAPGGALPEFSKAEETRHAAAAGQGQIMGLYESLFKTYDTHVAQILISVPGLQFADSRAATCETIAGIMKRGIVPIVNENDVIASAPTQGDGSIDPEELTITDNDAIAACLAVQLKVDLVMLLSDIDGVRASAEASTHFRSLTEEQLQRGDVSFGAKSSMGRGGMESKVKAARYLARRGVPCVIANGTRNRYIRTILDVARGKEIGTVFVPQKAA